MLYVYAAGSRGECVLLFLLLLLAGCVENTCCNCIYQNVGHIYSQATCLIQKYTIFGALPQLKSKQDTRIETFAQAQYGAFFKGILVHGC